MGTSSKNNSLQQIEKELKRSNSGVLLRVHSIYAKVSRWIIYYTIGLALLVTFAPWQQTADGQGRVIAFAPADRKQNITANVEGRISIWHAREGMVVEEGQLLAEIVDNDPEIIHRLELERDALQSRIHAAEMALETATRNIDRQRALLKEGVSAQRAVELAQVEYSRYKSDKATGEAELARLNVRLSRQRMQEVKAPKAGIIQQILVGENTALVKAGDVIAVIVPASSDRTVELWMAGIDLPFLKVGQHVQVQFEGWPVLQFSGLPEFSMGTFSAKVIVIDPTDNGNGYFRILAAPEDEEHWPSHQILRQGVKAKGWVQLNQVPIWFEVWRRLSALPPMPVPTKHEPHLDEKKDKGDSGDKK